MTNDNKLKPVVLTTKQLVTVQTLLRKYESHFKIASVKNKPLIRQTTLEGIQYNIITRKVNQVEQRHFYQTDVIVADQKNGTYGMVYIFLIREDGETPEEVTASITLDSLAQLANNSYLFQALQEVTRYAPGFSASNKLIHMESRDETVGIELSIPTLRVGKDSASVIISERYIVNKKVEKALSHEYLQNSAIWTMLKSYMRRPDIGVKLDPNMPVHLPRSVMGDVIDYLVKQPFEDIVVDKDTSHRVVSGVINTEGLIQPLDFELHVFITSLNRKQVAVFRLTGVNTQFTVTAMVDMEPQGESRPILKAEHYYHALDLLRKVGKFPYMEPRHVTEEQQISLHMVYKGRERAPTVKDYSPYEIGDKPFLLSHPSFTVFSPNLDHASTFTSFIAAPNKEGLSIAVVLTGNRTSEAKETMVRVTKEMTPTPVKEEVSTVQEPIPPIKEEDEDWAIPLLVGRKWPRVLRLDITTLQTKERPVYLAMLVPQYESFEKSIGYLAEDHQHAGVTALVAAKRSDTSLPFTLGLSAADAINTLELTLRRELKTAKLSGDEHALSLTAQALIERIIDTYKTIVEQFNKATKDGVVVAK